MRFVAILAGFVISVAATACGGNGGEEAEQPVGPSVRTFSITETEYKLQPASVRIHEPGVYTFRAVNKGQTDHALEIEGEGVEAETDTIGPGQSATVRVELKKASYEMYCPVDSHKEMGMKGTISVAGAAASTGTDTGDDSGYGSGYGGG